MKFLKNLFGPKCQHFWVIKEHITQKKMIRPAEYLELLGVEPTELIIAELYIQQCDKCGEIKHHKISMTG